jgi:hypothetical protein
VESVEFPVRHGGVAVRLLGVVRKGLTGRRRRWIPLNQPEKGMIVKTKEDQSESRKEN